MQKVLLAIDGITPTQKVVRYAIELCKYIKADLNVLQIISSPSYGKYMENLKQRINKARKNIEDSMIAATFAEAGEHEMAKTQKKQDPANSGRLPSGPEGTDVHFHWSMKSGRPDKEIVNYVSNNRDIVLTIYDAPEEETGDTVLERDKNIVPRRIMQELETPLVVLKRQ